MPEVGQNSTPMVGQFSTPVDILTLLADQSVYCHLHDQYPGFESLTHYPENRGILNAWLNNHPPWTVLRDAIRVSGIDAGDLLSLAKPFARLFVVEFVDFKATHMPELRLNALFRSIQADPDVLSPMHDYGRDKLHVPERKVMDSYSAELVSAIGRYLS